jgi:hypothetical protein
MNQKHNVAFSVSLAVSITASVVVSTDFPDACLSSSEGGQQKRLIEFISCTLEAMLACVCAVYNL